MTKRATWFLISIGLCLQFWFYLDAKTVSVSLSVVADLKDLKGVESAFDVHGKRTRRALPKMTNEGMESVQSTSGNDDADIFFDSEETNGQTIVPTYDENQKVKLIKQYETTDINKGNLREIGLIRQRRQAMKMNYCREFARLFQIGPVEVIKEMMLDEKCTMQRREEMMKLINLLESARYESYNNVGVKKK